MAGWRGLETKWLLPKDYALKGREKVKKVKRGEKTLSTRGSTRYTWTVCFAKTLLKQITTIGRGNSSLLVIATYTQSTGAHSVVLVSVVSSTALCRSVDASQALGQLSVHYS